MKNANKRLPTKQHLAWHEAEMGILIHYDITIFEPGYDFRKSRGYVPPPEKFNPTQLDTDQWIKTAADAGAKYAVLVVKHCSGFALWPTKAYPYSVASSPWRDGKGDILKDFIESCKKYNILPGIYYSTSCNAYMNVDNPGREITGNAERQKKYNRAVETMVDEIWGEYGDMFEIWFDGGVLPPEKGGPRLVERLIKYQLNAICFGGPDGFPALVRWGANEDGVAPDPCWGWTDMQQPGDGMGGEGQSPLQGAGKIDGEVWAPVESDMTIRDHQNSFSGGWFWKAGEDHLVYSVEHLLDCYDKTIGRGTNLMIGMVIDDRGLVPDADSVRFKEFGEAVKTQWGAASAETNCLSDEKKAIIKIPGKNVDRAMIMEDITNGQAIRKWKLEARGNDTVITLARGESVGHKRLIRFDPITADEFIFTVCEYEYTPIIRNFALFEAL